MKPFVINRYGRIVFPFNFFPALDFSVFETLEQFAAVIKRDFEQKAPTETDVAARLDAHAYAGRYDLLRDLALHLFWVNRYAMTMYDKRPTRWRDVPRHRDDVFLPVFRGWEGAELTATIEAGYRALAPSWDEGAEDRISRILLDVFRHKKGAGDELPAIKPTVSEILANPKSLTYHLLAWDPDYPGYGWDDIIEHSHRVPELEALMRQAMVLHNQYRWDRGKTRLIEVGKLHDDDFVVVFQPRNDDVLQFIRRVKGGRRARLRRPAGAVEVLVVDDAGIRRLNAAWRGVRRRTDVLAFPLEAPGLPSPLLGQVVVSAQAAQRQARRVGVTLATELDLLVTHGVLHLVGYDDRDPVEAALMHRRERAILADAPERLWKGLLRR